MVRRQSTWTGTNVTNNVFGIEELDMPDPIERIRQKLVERVRQIVEDHRPTDHTGAGKGCSCGAQDLSDHCRHVAEQIIDGLQLKPDDVDEAKKRIRYASAWFDWELTKLEGAEC